VLGIVYGVPPRKVSRHAGIDVTGAFQYVRGRSIVLLRFSRVTILRATGRFLPCCRDSAVAPFTVFVAMPCGGYSRGFCALRLLGTLTSLFLCEDPQSACRSIQVDIGACVAAQALSETLLLITPYDDLYISLARSHKQYNIHSLLIFQSTIPAPNRATAC
jgi:hypothetical protein